MAKQASLMKFFKTNTTREGEHAENVEAILAKKRMTQPSGQSGWKYANV